MNDTFVPLFLLSPCSFKVMFYMRHVKDTFGFTLPFVIAGGLQSLGTLFAHDNLFLRSQALDAFLRISGLEELDWFVDPVSVAEAARKADPMSPGRSLDEGTVLRLHERLRDVARGSAIRALFHNDGAPGTGGDGAAAPGEATTFPGGGYYALQALAFFLSWLRLRCTPEQKLPLSRSMLLRLQAWATCESESVEGRELAQKLFDDFCRLPPVTDEEAGGDGMCLWPVLERLGAMGIAAHESKKAAKAAQGEQDEVRRGEFQTAKAKVDAEKERKKAKAAAEAKAEAKVKAKAAADAKAKVEAIAKAEEKVKAAKVAKAAKAAEKEADAAKAKTAAAAKVKADDRSDDSAAKTTSDYYFFNSDGKKPKNKWDTFDVDAECERLDQEVEEETRGVGKTHASWGESGSGCSGGGGDKESANVPPTQLSKQDAILAKLLKRNSRPAEVAAEPLVTCRPKHLDAHKTKADPTGTDGGRGGGGAAVVADDAPDSDDDVVLEDLTEEVAASAGAPTVSAAQPPLAPAPEPATDDGTEKTLRAMDKPAKEKKAKKEKGKKKKKSSQMDAMRKLAASASKLHLE